MLSKMIHMPRVVQNQESSAAAKRFPQAKRLKTRPSKVGPGIVSEKVEFFFFLILQVVHDECI